MKKIIILACSCFLLAACGNSAKTNNSTGTDSTAGIVHLMKKELIRWKVIS